MIPKRKKRKWKPRSGYNSPEYIRWRNAVFKRDKYRCQYPGCRNRSGYIQAHHIKKWANNPLLRFLPSNGLSLCKRHHTKVTGREEYYEKLFILIVNLKRKR